MVLTKPIPQVKGNSKNTNKNKITININNVYFLKSKNTFLKCGGVTVQKLIQYTYKISVLTKQ